MYLYVLPHYPHPARLKWGFGRGFNTKILPHNGAFDISVVPLYGAFDKFLKVFLAANPHPSLHITPGVYMAC